MMSAHMNRGWTLSLLLAAACIPPAGGGTGGGGGGTSGGERATGDPPRVSRACAEAEYGAEAAAQKVEAFLAASAGYVDASLALESELAGSCRRMGEALGMDAAVLNGKVSDVCNAVGTELKNEMLALRTEASLRIDIAARPPRCEVDIDAYARCAAECDATVTPGEIDVQCEGGYIAGQCSAECTGECSVSVEGQCAGSCEGTCSGGCSGTCQGVCEGTCSATGADGQCNGSCEGTCHGTCSAGCQGSCEGECWVDGRASCEGMCRGGCSVEYERPRCYGTVRPPEVDVDCRASCDARFSADVQCEPGQVDVVIAGEISSDFQPRADRVRAALRAGWGQMKAIGAKLERLVQAGRELYDSIANLRGTGRTIGQALLCVGQAAVAVPAALARVQVSVEVQVSFSAEVSAGVGG